MRSNPINYKIFKPNPNLYDQFKEEKTQINKNIKDLIRLSNETIDPYKFEQFTLELFKMDDNKFGQNIQLAAQELFENPFLQINDAKKLIFEYMELVNHHRNNLRNLYKPSKN